MSLAQRVADLSTWTGAQIKATRALLPAWRSRNITTTVTLALGTATDIPVTWATALPDASYAVWVQPTGTTGINGQVAFSVKSVSASGCVVTIKPQLALLAGFTFTVYAVRLPNGAANYG